MIKNLQCQTQGHYLKIFSRKNLKGSLQYMGMAVIGKMHDYSDGLGHMPKLLFPWKQQ